MLKYLTTGWTVFENNIWDADEVMKEFSDDVSVTSLLFEDQSEWVSSAATEDHVSMDAVDTQ